MDITREEFNAWTKDARVIAQANGQTTTSLMEMVKIYAQAGEDISDVQDKLAGYCYDSEYHPNGMLNRQLQQ